MGSDPPSPSSSRLSDGPWALSDEYVETVFEGLGVTVEGRNRVYEDAALRERIAAAGGPDRVWRFFFVSRLSISPSPGFGMASVARPHVVRESKAAFGDELRDRGFVGVETDETTTVRVADHRATLTPHRARLPLAGDAVSVVGALAVWHDDDFIVAGGAYPEAGLERWVEGGVDADAYEDELLSLIRAVA